MMPLLLMLALAAQDAPATRGADVPIPEKIESPAAQDDPPTVSIRTEENGDIVEEYRQGGRLYMVKITPERGPAYYLMDSDGDGRLNRDDNGPRVRPVYWKIYEWN